MDRITSIGITVVLSVLMSGVLVAQQTSTASQVVTFGVSRAPLMLVNSIASMSGSLATSSGLMSRTFRRRLATLPVKITVSSKDSGHPAVAGKESSTSAMHVFRAPSPESEIPRTWGITQKDLRIFVRENTPASFGNTALVLTITQ